MRQKREHNFVAVNKSGEVIRYINWQSTKLYIVKLKNTQRIEFIENLKALEKEGIEFEMIKELSKPQVQKQAQPISGLGSIKSLHEVTWLQKDVSATPEDEDQMPVILKYTAGGYVAILAFILMTSFVINYFFDDSEKEVVQVVAQARVIPKKTHRTQTSPRKKRIKKARTAKRRLKAKSKVRNRSVARNGRSKKRHGKNIKKLGALGALGGSSRKYSNSTGRNINAKTNSGIGYGKTASRGGHARSLVGKGLVKGGYGGSQKIRGYNGYGTKGKGGGKPGYGQMKIAGSSGAYFTPLADESLVEGGLDRDQINAVIQRNRGQIEYCYEKQLQVKPKLAGTVSVKFVINGSGRVSTANVGHSSMRSSKVESCILNKLRRWKFPQPTGRVNVKVTYPFQLRRISKG